jgi:tetratricopeptide (TPR) repeat protein
MVVVVRFSLKVNTPRQDLTRACLVLTPPRCYSLLRSIDFISTGSLSIARGGAHFLRLATMPRPWPNSVMVRPLVPMNPVAKQRSDATHREWTVEKGNRSFRDKHYEDALKYFKEALAFAPDSLLIEQALNILDRVVDAHVKLQQLDQALVHAKAMIRRDRSDARGYLRCGQLMRMQNDPDAAQKWYAQGLKNVKPDDRHRQALVPSLEKCQKLSVIRLTSSKPCDPFTCLPTEIVSMLLRYFDYKNLLPLLQVCRSWKRFLSSQPILTETIDFSRASTPITHIELRTAVRRLNQSPRKADIRDLSNPACDYLKTRFRDWAKNPSLQHLVLRPADGINVGELELHRHPLRYLFVATEQESLPLSPFLKILLECLDVETLMIHSRKSHIYTTFQPPASFCQHHLRHLHISAALQISSFSCFPNLEILHFHAHATQLNPRPPPRCDLQLADNAKLRHVYIGGNDHTASLPYRLEKLVLGTRGACNFGHVSGLESLSIMASPGSVTECSGIVWQGNFTTVRELSLTFSYDHLDVTYPRLSSLLDPIFGACYQVAKLRLLNARGLDDPQFARITANMPLLEAIEITAADITGASLADLVRRPGNRVNSVALSECHLVSSDTWDWMRQCGINTHGGHRQYRF